jgi:hypothetical protein
MLNTFQNSASVLSIGVFFTVLVLGLSASLPSHLYDGLVANGLPRATALKVSHLPPIGSLFAAFLGYNPVQQLVSPAALHALTAHQQAVVTGRSFFPRVFSTPFGNGLHLALDFAAATSLIAAAASWLRGGRYVHATSPLAVEMAKGMAGVGAAASEEVGAGADLAELQIPSAGGAPGVGSTTHASKRTEL